MSVMSIEWQITLFAVLGGWAAAITAAGCGMAFLLSNRITRVETQFEDWLDKFGVAAAKALHSPDDHLGIDYYLDQYVSHYYDMTMKQWKAFREICCGAIESESSTKMEKIQAEFLKHLCDHKLQRCLDCEFNKTK